MFMIAAIRIQLVVCMLVRVVAFAARPRRRAGKPDWSDPASSTRRLWPGWIQLRVQWRR